jgi:16S rRNA (adenine1518-N6/adenine1519-N6)-dimethyltransferase
VRGAAPVSRPKKRLGQHFLHDPGTIERIVHAISPQPGDRLVEIGPGRGAITVPLLSRAGAIDVVELDRDVVPVLEARCRGHGELRVHLEDALEFNLGALRGAGAPLRLVGNLPYNISTPLLFRFVAQLEAIADMHFMLQKEVVDRMVAPPGGRDYGRLTVMLAAACAATALFRVGRGAFQPPPAVDSAVVRLVPHAADPFPLPDPQRFARVVAAAFSMRRKTLRNSLRGLVDETGFAAAGIDPGRRPETLAPAEFGRLAAIMAAP